MGPKWSEYILSRHTICFISWEHFLPSAVWSSTNLVLTHKNNSETYIQGFRQNNLRTFYEHRGGSEQFCLNHGYTCVHLLTMPIRVLLSGHLYAAVGASQLLFVTGQNVLNCSVKMFFLNKCILPKFQVMWSMLFQSFCWLPLALDLLPGLIFGLPDGAGPLISSLLSGMQARCLMWENHLT